MTSTMRRLILLSAGVLVAFLLTDSAHWLPSQMADPLVLRVYATPDLQVWLEDARTHFLATSPRPGGRPLSVIIDYAEDAAVSGEIAADGQRATGPAAAPSTGAFWLTSRTAVQLVEPQAPTLSPELAVIPVASTLFTVLTWETQARDALAAAGVISSLSQPLSWNDVDISWTAWHRLSIQSQHGSRHQRKALRWLIPHPLRSAAGLASLMLISLGDAGPMSVRWPDEAGEQMLLPWLADFFSSTEHLRPSARDTANDFIKLGPTGTDVALLPEHLALEVLAQTAAGAGPEGVILYPRVNLNYEYVAVETNGSAAPPLQREAFAAFCRYLRSDEGQSRGLAHGLRPLQINLMPRRSAPWRLFSAQGAQFSPQVIWTDGRALVEPASRLARRLMAQVHAP